MEHPEIDHKKYIQCSWWDFFVIKCKYSKILKRAKIKIETIQSPLNMCSLIFSTIFHLQNVIIISYQKKKKRSMNTGMDIVLHVYTSLCMYIYFN